MCSVIAIGACVQFATPAIKKDATLALARRTHRHDLTRFHASLRKHLAHRAREHVPEALWVEMACHRTVLGLVLVLPVSRRNMTVTTVNAHQNASPGAGASVESKQVLRGHQPPLRRLRAMMFRWISEVPS